MTVIASSYEVESGFDTTLKNSISPTQTSGIIINKVPTVFPAVLNFDPDTSKEEWVGYGSFTDNGDGTCTLLEVTRGLNLVGDTFTGNATRTASHSGGSCKVVMTDYHSIFNLKANKDRANTFTADQTLATGTKINLGDSTATIRRDGNDLKFKDPNQSEVSLSQLAAAAGLDEKTKVSATDTTAGYIDDKQIAGDGLYQEIVDPAGNEKLKFNIDLTDTTKFKTARTTNESIAVVTDPVTGKVSPTFIDSIGTDATFSETIAAGDVVVGTSTSTIVKSVYNDTDKFANILGIAKEGGVASDIKSVVTSAPLVNASIYGATSTIVTTTITSDTTLYGNSSAPRIIAQTFLATTTGSLLSVDLLLTKTGSTGVQTVTVGLYSTTVGVPNVLIATADSTIPFGAGAVALALYNATFTGVTLTAGTIYAVVLSFSSTQDIVWNGAASSVYVDGSGYSKDGAAAWASASKDQAMNVYVSDSATLVTNGVAYLDSTAGKMTARPLSTTYVSTVGKIFPNSKLLLNPRKTVYATYTFSGAGTVDTTITVGGTVKQMQCLLTYSTASNVGSMGYYTDNLPQICNGSSGTAGAVPLWVKGQIGYLHNTTGPITCDLTVVNQTNNTITIRRINTAHTFNVYLLIELY